MMDNFQEDFSKIPVAIFCGGRGTRLKEETEVTPKPLVKIGDHPIVWHIMKIFSAQGFRRFVLLTGYKGEKIREYFYHYPLYQSDFTLSLAGGRRTIAYHGEKNREDWEVTVLDTGLTAETGCRLKRAEKFLSGGTFLLTYGDGVSDVDVRRLLNFHRTHKAMITVTAVEPPARFGEIRTEGVHATNFWEKTNMQSGRINGGFFVVEPEIFSKLSSDPELNFEKNVLPQLAKDRNLTAYMHNGYWQCMDTVRDMEVLNEEWRKGSAPWKIWPPHS